MAQVVRLVSKQVPRYHSDPRQQTLVIRRIWPCVRLSRPASLLSLRPLVLWLVGLLLLSRAVLLFFLRRSLVVVVFPLLRRCRGGIRRRRTAPITRYGAQHVRSNLGCTSLRESIHPIHHPSTTHFLIHSSTLPPIHPIPPPHTSSQLQSGPWQPWALVVLLGA